MILSSSSSFSSAMVIIITSFLLLLVGPFPSYAATNITGNSSHSEVRNAGGVDKKITERHPPRKSMQRARGFMLSEEVGSTIEDMTIAVPNKTGFEEFVRWSKTGNEIFFEGYSIEVFKQAVKELDYKLNYRFVLYGDGDSTPSYDNMITALSDGKYDAVVGDITIRSDRLKIIDFTQPYSESGLVVVAPVKEDHFSETWAFLKPFTVYMWIITGIFLLFTGLVVWILEHKQNPNFRGPPREQVTTIFWFICSTVFFAHRENIKSALGRVVVIVWLFVVMIIVSSYTANLTSILTVRSLSPTIDGINSLRRSSARIGYQTGSFVKDYLIHELHIEKERLVNFSKVEDYANALRLGPNNLNGVAAIVDELPYVQLFLNKECGFAIAGQEFTRSGWGYAFPKDSKIGKDLSVAILHLSESGHLQEIHDRWLSMDECNSQLHSNSLGMESFKGLFIITGITSGACLLIFFLGLMIRFRTKYKNSTSSSSSSGNLHGDNESSPSIKVLKSFASYFDESNPPHEQGRFKRSPKVTPSNLQTPPPEPSNDAHPKKSQNGDNINQL